jgi:4-hydroxybenzoate polyprenyltransferase
VAGGPPLTAIRLGVAMIAIQAAIGTVNDIVDVDRDQGVKPGKPLPGGVVGMRSARLVAVVAIALGLALSILSGPAAAAVALLGLAVGLAYDMRLKGTAWSWLAFAIGLPLLPVYAWLGAAGGLPGSFAVLVPTAVGAGAALAIANALADVERDLAAGVASVAVALGREAAWGVHLVLHITVFVVAFGSVAMASMAGPQPPSLALPMMVLGALLVVAGACLARSSLASRRERAWELEAIGIGIAALGWIGRLGSAG